jgi:hypothetical protein
MQAVHSEGHPVRPSDGHPAIFERDDNPHALLVAAQQVRREAHSKAHVDSGQARPVYDCLLDDTGVGGGSFASFLPHMTTGDYAYAALPTFA